MSEDKLISCSEETIAIANKWARRNPKHPLAKVLDSAIQYLGAVIIANEDEPIDHNFAATELLEDSFDYRRKAEAAAYDARDIVVRAVIKQIKKEKKE